MILDSSWKCLRRGPYTPIQAKKQRATCTKSKLVAIVAQSLTWLPFVEACHRIGLQSAYAFPHALASGGILHILLCDLRIAFCSCFSWKGLPQHKSYAFSIYSFLKLARKTFRKPFFSQVASSLLLLLAVLEVRPAACQTIDGEGWIYSCWYPNHMCR